MRKNKTRGIFATFALVLALAAGESLAACSTEPVIGRSDNDTTSTFQTGEATFTPAAITQTSAKKGAAVKIEKEGWNAKDSYVHYGIMVTNPNADLVARDTAITVTAYDAKGKVLDRGSATIEFIGPGKTIGFAGNKVGNGTKPAKVKISLDGDSTIWQDATGYTDPFTIDDFDEENALYRRYQITGDIANHTDEYASTVPLSFICFDKNDKIVGGYVGEAYRIKPGRTKSFKLTINTVPSHERTEAYPQVYVEGAGESASNSPYY